MKEQTKQRAALRAGAILIEGLGAEHVRAILIAALRGLGYIEAAAEDEAEATVSILCEDNARTLAILPSGIQPFSVAKALAHAERIDLSACELDVLQGGADVTTCAKSVSFDDSGTITKEDESKGRIPNGDLPGTLDELAESELIDWFNPQEHPVLFQLALIRHSPTGKPGLDAVVRAIQSGTGWSSVDAGGGRLQIEVRMAPQGKQVFFVNVGDAALLGAALGEDVAPG